MTNKISMRLQTPPDETGNRKDIHPITTSDEVIVDPDTKNSISLTEKLNRISTIHIQETKPNFPCIWAKPIS